MQATITIAADRRAPSTAREWVDDVAARLDDPLRDDLRLIVSEIVTNAVKYGVGTPIHVCLHVRAPDRVRGVVIDHGPNAHQIRLRSPDALSSGGRGLRIVHELADRWGVEEGSTHVWFQLDSPH
jgi:anti-sigma regulatory factor (Ser/Thr protein kinase)